MTKRTMVCIVIVSLVTVAAIGIGIFLHARSKDHARSSLPPVSSQDVSGSSDPRYAPYRLTPEQLEKMTDEELLQAVIDYPYLVDIFLTDHPEDAVPSIKEHCDALRELIDRGTAAEMIDSYLAGHEKIATAEEELLRDQLKVIRDNL